ncbi:hypothetical protein AWB81_04471 [Caballeronia arationis]|jgi:hypothetical protein|uniref:Uncharacterized protein n=1 Tax=Caballeronia arationis TaxID=1777142 RepID=A0A7Z7I338_9BURK|nr:hypothetical protein [Caballeronia arationis]SAK86834.1 hypothetical protein AWB81_04471 [Caballeronia arationis]SOE57619.1 hypothetical protein SAMN05446927_1471 [Caballeronia arationis]
METLTIDAASTTGAPSNLTDLWRRRTHLSHDEMVSIYNLVKGALRTYHPPELQSLREDKEELIAQFIYSKVLRLEPGHGESHASEQSAPSTGYAVCAYFRRFLIDCLRSASYQRDVSMELDGIGQQVDERAHVVDDPVESVLSQYGLDEARVRHLARGFISGLDRYEQLVLAGTLGWCSGGKGGLFGLATQHQIPSYHYRAMKLGVTLKKSARSEDFASTKIGRWIVGTLGIEISLDNQTAILLILNLLAVESSQSMS